VRALREAVSGAAGPFLRARLLALYLLSAAAVLGAAAAWTPRAFASPLPPAAWAAGLAAAALAGAAFHDRFAWIAERAGRGRLRAVGGTVHAAVLFFAFVGLLLRQRDAVETGLRWLSGFQILLLLLAGFGRAHLGAVLNAGALVVLAGFAGGPAGAASVVAHVAFLVVFLSADHVARKLAEYPVEDAPGAGLLLREAGLPALLAAAALSGYFALVPPEPYEVLLVRPPGSALVGPELLTRIALQALGIALLGAVAFYLVLRWGAGGATSGDGSDVDRVRARRRIDLPPPPADLAPEPPAEGVRGRIIRAYLQRVAQLAKRGLRRRRGQTPAEFSARLGASAEAGELTALFERARYGGEEPGEGEAERAERALRALQNGDSSG
jgi:hypothetical protein